MKSEDRLGESGGEEEGLALGGELVDKEGEFWCEGRSKESVCLIEYLRSRLAPCSGSLS